MSDAPPDDTPAVRVVLRPIATALPLGFFSFALGMVLLGALALGWVPASEQRTVGILVAAYVFPLELAAAVLAFLGRDAVGGTTLGLFATSWLAVGLVDVVAPAGTASAATGLFEVALALVIACVAVVAAPGKPLFAVVLGLATLRSLLEGLHQLTGSSALATAGGAVALVLALAGIYAGLALLMEHAWPRPVLPVWRRGQSADVMEGAMTQPSQRLTAQPGVREQL